MRALAVLGLLLQPACSDDAGAEDGGTEAASSTAGADGVDSQGDDDGEGPGTMSPGDDGDDGTPGTDSTGPSADDDDTAGPADTGSTGEPPEVPAGWTCDPFWYGAMDACDCGCGEPDPDCADATAASCEDCSACSPFVMDCATVVDAANNALCGTGRCGNGMVEGGEACDGDASLPADLDCVALGFEAGTVACDADCSQVDLAMCTGGPEGWTCEASYYDADDGCDCGCGVVDPDCADMTSASCEYCNVIGSCVAFDGDCTAVDPANNAACP